MMSPNPLYRLMPPPGHVAVVMFVVTIAYYVACPMM